MAIKVMGLDTAKHVFQVHGADANGKTVLRKRLRRSQVAEFFNSFPACIVGMEATCGAHYWARVIGSFGHEVRLIAPQFVKPYVKGQKNDVQDAPAICEAVSRPEMRFVPQKSVEQQDLQALHRIRSRLIGCRTQLGNQIRGLLAEYGILLPLHLSQVRLQLPQLFAEDHPQLTSFGRELFGSLHEELCALDRRIQAAEERIQRVFAHIPSRPERDDPQLRGRIYARSLILKTPPPHSCNPGRVHRCPLNPITLIAIWLDLLDPVNHTKPGPYHQVSYDYLPFGQEILPPP